VALAPVSDVTGRVPASVRKVAISWAVLGSGGSTGVAVPESVVNFGSPRATMLDPPAAPERVASALADGV
jgi:hypothetical protein